MDPNDALDSIREHARAILDDADGQIDLSNDQIRDRAQALAAACMDLDERMSDGSAPVPIAWQH